MFSSAANSAVYFARRTVFTTLCKQARFLSVSAVSSTKNLYNESVLFSEKPSKSAKAKKDNNKKFEQSQLYPIDMDKSQGYDFEEFDLLMDDKTPLIQKDPRSDELESVAKKSGAVGKMPQMQELERSAWSGSVAKKSEAVDKMPPMQELERSAWPGSVAKKSEAVERFKISEREEIDLLENDFGERLSDSDSESEAEYITRTKRASRNFQVDLNNLNIIKQGRRSRFFREQMDKATSPGSELMWNDEVNGIFALAQLGIMPETLFFSFTLALKQFPGDLSNTALHMVSFEEIKYWSYRARTPETSVIGVYRKEALKLKTGSSDLEMPLTIICDHVWHRTGFAHMLISAAMAPPKVFITTKDCAHPWHGAVVRNSRGQATFLNHDFGLTWDEIRQKVDGNDRVYLLDLPLKKDGEDTEYTWSSIPSVNLYDHNFWDGGNMTLVVVANTHRRTPEESPKFCTERNALRIDPCLTRRPFALAVFQMVFFELRRQWLARQK